MQFIWHKAFGVCPRSQEQRISKFWIGDPFRSHSRETPNFPTCVLGGDFLSKRRYPPNLETFIDEQANTLHKQGCFSARLPTILPGAAARMGFAVQSGKTPAFVLKLQQFTVSHTDTLKVAVGCTGYRQIDANRPLFVAIETPSTLIITRKSIALLKQSDQSHCPHEITNKFCIRPAHTPLPVLWDLR